ncbi:MAG: zinc ribbon domain-containing protein [Acidobacteriaceae bacterium]
MEQRIYHGNLSPIDLGEALLSRFNHGNLRAQQLGDAERLIVQICTRPGAVSGGDMTISVILQKVEDGVAVQLGQQAWLGIAASLGTTALAAMRNPFNLLGRLDDLAQDIQNLQINDEVWQAIDEVARAAGASSELSERLRRMVCPYCRTANPVGEPNCIACGAPLGEVQPFTCPHCGFVVKSTETVCPNCKRPLPVHT